MDAANRNTALASAFAEELARCGLRRAVICPGSRSTPIALALLREPTIETVSIVDERSAGFNALGAALAAREPVAVVCTSGTAAANLHPAVCESDEAGVPLLVLTSDRPPELRDVGAGQTIDQLNLYGSAPRWFCEVGTHDADDAGLLHMRATACRAFAIAAGDPRPGPVHLNLSWRDPLGPEPRDGDVTAKSPLALGGRGDLPLNDVHRAPAAPASEALAALAADISETPRGLILAGLQTDAELAEPLAAFARAAGYPILAEPTSQLRLGPHERDLVVWPYDVIARARPAALQPELVVRFGEMPTSKPLREWLSPLDGCAQLVVDPGGAWNDPSRRAGLTLRCDPAALASSLAARLPGDRDLGIGWPAAWRRAADAAAAEIASELAGLAAPTEPGVLAALGRLFADGDVVFTASSMPVRDQEGFVPSRDASVLFLSNRGANGIDGVVSSGIGAASASARPTWIVLGDLCLHHDSNGLATLRHVSTPVRIVCLNNDGGGIFEFLPQAAQVDRDEFEAAFGTPLGLDLAKLADLYGIEHRLVTELGAFADPGEGHVLYEVPVDRRANVAVHHALWETAAAAVVNALAAD